MITSPLFAISFNLAKTSARVPGLGIFLFCMLQSVKLEMLNVCFSICDIAFDVDNTGNDAILPIEVTAADLVMMQATVSSYEWRRASHFRAISQIT